MRFLRKQLFILSAIGGLMFGARATPASDDATSLTTLSSTELCNQCNGTLLPGRTMPQPETKWGIISDLPESFGSYGVLYSTRDVLPDNGGSEELRHQRKANGFTTIDGGFDLFFFHLSRMTTGSRVVVYVKNKGDKPVGLFPHQVIKSEGTIGSQHQFESTLGKRVLARLWDQVEVRALSSASVPMISFKASARPDEISPTVSIPPGQGKVIAYGKQFGPVEDGEDSSRNVNCFGYVRAKLANAHDSANLEVDVIAIPAGPREQMEAAAAKLVNTGAKSTDEVPMDREQQGCALGRAVGVYPNFYWKNDPLVLDVAHLDAGGTSFPMCLPKVQTNGCADARQTTDLVVRPGYTREDTIGNYMIEYEVRARLINSGSQPASAILVFSKTGADVGLAYAIKVSDSELANPFENVAVNSLWAGPKQSAMEKSLLEGGQPISIVPGQARYVSLRFLVCGNSSLPFFLGFKGAAAPQ